MPSRSTQSSKIEILQPYQHVAVVWGTGGYTLVDNSQSGVTVRGHVWGMEKHRSWTRTPDFKAKKRDGELPMNPFTTEVITEAPHATVEVRYGTLVSNPDGSGMDNRSWVKVPVRTLYSPPQVVEFMNLFNLQSRLVEKMKGAQWNAPVFIAEARKTADMVVSTATTIWSVWKNLRKGKYDLALEELGIIDNNVKRARLKRQWYYETYRKSPDKAAANAWLQSQYGWIPLLSDVKSAAEVLASMVHDDRATFRVKVRSKETQDRLREVPFSGQPFIGDGKVSIKEHWTDSAQYVVHYRPSDLYRYGQIGLLNPAMVMWELLPFSFVADWFVPIGDYLNGLDAGIQFTFEKGLYSRKTSVHGEVIRCDGGILEGNSSYSRTLVYAQKMGAIPTPSLSGLAFQPYLNAKRITSAIALIRQVTTRKG